MSRRYLLHGLAAILLGLAALIFIRLHDALGTPAGVSSVAEGHRLAEAWCKACHSIDMERAGTATSAPDFVAIAIQPSTTELSLKVFFRSNHHKMPNLLLNLEQADNLASYILSLKHR